MSDPTGLKRLSKIVRHNDDWLIRRVLEYAKKLDYTRYTSTLEEAWRQSVEGISESIVKAVDCYEDIPELGPDEDFTIGPLSQFGVIEAQKHRQRGISLSMFLGLMKYYRQAYIDLIHEKVHKRQQSFLELYLSRCFDRIELSFTQEWANLGDVERIEELEQGNRSITNEKNSYLSVFESISDPIILVDPKGVIVNLNLAAQQLLTDDPSPGAVYYKRPDNAIDVKGGKLTRVFPWIPDLTGGSHSEFCRSQSGKELWYECDTSEILDISGKTTGRVVTLRDVTEARSARSDLLTYRMAVESSTTLVAAVDRSYRYVLANKAFCDQRGLRQDEVVGRLVPDILGEEMFQDRIKPLLDRSFAGQETRFEMDYEYPEKGLRYLEVSYFPLRDSDDEALGAVAIIQDVSERRLAENALIESQNKLALAQEVSGAATFEYDVPGGTSPYLDSQWRKLLGYDQGDLTDTDRIMDWMHDKLHPDDVRNLMERHNDFAKGKLGDLREEVRIRHKDGHWVHLLTFFHGLKRNEDWSVARVLGVVVDISSQKRVENALRESEQKYRQIFHTAGDGIALLDDLTITDCNDRFAEMFKLPVDSIIGKTPVDLAPVYQPDGTPSAEMVRSTISATGIGDLVSIEFQHIASDGVLFDTEINLSTFEVTGSVRRIAVLRNVTARKRAEEALHKAHRDLERLSKLDGLTEIANRRLFDELFLREWQSARRDKTELSVVLFDIDMFKAYNDHYGHLAGDHCLKTISSSLSSRLKRSTDLIARYGGEEFVVLLPSTSKEGALQLAEELRSAIRMLGIEHVKTKIGIITASFGVSTTVPQRSGDSKTLIHAADTALYRAKDAGRDTVLFGEIKEESDGL